MKSKILICGALVATLGAGAVFAADFNQEENRVLSEKLPGGVMVSDKDGKLIIMSKVENGVRSYSTDGGKTWSEKVPDGEQ